MNLGPIIAEETPKITLGNSRFRAHLTKLLLTSEINPLPTAASPVVERNTRKAGKTTAEVTCGLSLGPPSAFGFPSTQLHPTVSKAPMKAAVLNDSRPRFSHTNHPFCSISPRTVRVHPAFTCLLLNR